MNAVEDGRYVDLVGVNNNERREHAQAHHLLLRAQALLTPRLEFQAQVALAPQHATQLKVLHDRSILACPKPRHIVKMHNPPAARAYILTQVMQCGLLPDLICLPKSHQAICQDFSKVQAEMQHTTQRQKVQ